MNGEHFLITGAVNSATFDPQKGCYTVKHPKASSAKKELAFGAISAEERAELFSTVEKIAGMRVHPRDHKLVTSIYADPDGATTLWFRTDGTAAYVGLLPITGKTVKEAKRQAKESRQAWWDLMASSTAMLLASRKKQK